MYVNVARLEVLVPNIREPEGLSRSTAGVTQINSGGHRTA